MIDGPQLANRLSLLFALRLIADGGTGSANTLSLRVADIEPPNGFAIIISLAWRSIEAKFAPDPFASQLIKSICNSSDEQRQGCSQIAAGFRAKGIRPSFQIDGSNIDLGPLPQGEWKRFAVSCVRFTDHEAAEKDAEDVATACLSLVLALLQVEPADAEIIPPQFEQEGAASRHEVTRYERSPANRAAAIAFHGLTCKACDFDFAKSYGAIGEGFIEVHHTKPVSQLGGPVIIDPMTDLVPLCSNCHRMVHRQDPPIPVEELRDILNQNRGKFE